MNNKLSRKEELRKELNKIEEKEFKDIITAEFPKLRDLVLDKYFKYRNSYGGDNKGWWLYRKVTDINPSDVYLLSNNEPTARCKGFSFEIRTNGEISIQQKDDTYIHILGQEITEREFNEAWNKMCDKIKAL